jgi:hypothetical protein
MMNTYWPRRAHLEVEQFQPSLNDANDMRVPRDEKNKPELQVRAFEWVIADRDPTKAPYGWRALRWKDLSEHKLVDQALLAKVTIPTEFEHWQLDTDELEPNLVAALFIDEIKGRSSGEVRAYFNLPHVKQKIALRRPKDKAELDDWLDWTTWTADKIGLQKKNTNARTPLRDLNNEATNYNAHLDEIFAKLNELAESPSMSRTIRKLAIPKVVAANFRGSDSGRNDTPEWQEGNKFRISLDELAGSPRFKFRARAENYFTPAKMITLVASPATKEISIDKEEPAYQHYVLNGPDQTPLGNLKHLTERLAYSTTGDTNTFELPLGSKLVIHVRIDRKLRGERPVVPTDPPLPDPNFASFQGNIALDADREGFSLELNNIIRMHDFMVEFYDEDNIRGKRRFKVLRTLDAEPHVGNLNVFSYLPRKPKFKAAAPADKEKDKDKNKDNQVRDLREQNELANAYLITPDAKIPLECLVKDDYGLVQVGYHFKHRKVDFELIAQGGASKLPALEIDQTTRRYHAHLIGSNFQFWPGNPLAWHVGPTYLAATADRVQKDLRIAQSYREDYIPSKGFQDLLGRRASEMISLETLKQKLTGGRGPRAWEFDFKDDPGFDLQKFTPEFKQTDPEKGGQMHYLLQLAVQATDNNVETGAEYRYPISQVGGPERKILRGNTKKNANGYLSFIVVSENELLSQIALEEEMLFEKLEIAKEKVDLGITSLLEQQSKTQNKNADLEQILNRMNEIRTALGTAGNNVREAHQAYENILKEMDVNRVRAERVKKIQDAIITRLDTIVVKDMSDQRNPNNTGSFVRAEEAFQKAHLVVEEDSAAKRPPDGAAHRENMGNAHQQMVRLSDDIRLVLDAMSEGIVESKAIALLTFIEQVQRAHTQMLNNLQRDLLEKAINDLLKDDDKDIKKDKGKDKNKDKQPEKNSSQLRTLPIDSPILLAARLTNPERQRGDGGMPGVCLPVCQQPAIPSLALRVSERKVVPEFAGTAVLWFWQVLS